MVKQTNQRRVVPRRSGEQRPRRRRVQQVGKSIGQTIKSNADTAYQAGGALAKGSASKASESVVQRAAGTKLDELGARKARKRRALKKRRERQTGQKQQSPPKKMTGWGFYAVLALAFLKDGVDIISDLTVIFFWISTIAATLLIIVLGFYYRLNDVKPTTRKMVRWVIYAIIELIPFGISLLPTSGISVITTRTLENNELAQKALQKAKNPKQKIKEKMRGRKRR